MTDIRPETSRLATELGLLRERSGLSFAALAEQTPYSKSAWQRYLTAKALPPWSAVQALCELSGEPQAKLRALWELAESAASGRGTVSHTAPVSPSREAAPIVGSVTGVLSVPPTAPAVRTWRQRIPGAAAISLLLCLALLATLTALHVRPWGDTHQKPQAAATTLAENSNVNCTGGPCDVTCKGASCTGLDPGLTFCGAEPRTLQNLQTPTGIGLEIRYNQKCQAAWARVWNTRIGDTLTLTAQGAPTQTIRVSDAQEANGYTFTPLIYVSSNNIVLKACVTSPGETGQCYTATAS